MDVRALLLVHPSAGSAIRDCAETLGGVPIAFLPVLGRPVVHHLIERLGRYGVSHFAIISDITTSAPAYQYAANHPQATLTAAGRTEFWRAAEAAFSSHAQSGADLILVLRVGAYLELDLDELIQFHLEQRSRVTAVAHPQETLDVFLINSSRRNDAAFLFRHRLARARTPPACFTFRGYVNPLLDARDLRRLAVDTFAARIQVAPAARQLRPGIWVQDGARIQHGARILAPAFIGARSKICAAAVLTRGACVEHHCHVDCGTVIEDSTLLPYTYVGAGLDVAHAVAGFGRLAHLRRNVEIEISDPKLLHIRPRHAGLRALGSAAALAAFLPKQILRGLFAPSHREPPTSLAEAVKAPSLALATSFEEAGTEGDASKFPVSLAIVRRYGGE